MNQKTFIILFTLITLLAVVGISFTKLQESSKLSASPSPVPGDLESSKLNMGNADNSQRNNSEGQAILNQEQIHITPQQISQAKPQAPAPVQNQPQTQTQQQTAPQQQQQQQAPADQWRQIAPKRYNRFPGILAQDILQNKKVVIVTDKGNIEIGIYPEAPMAASNFLLLANDKFYDGLIFHRIEPGFVIQGGDPQGTGTGGPGYTFPDETVLGEYTRGTVAMANAGPNTNGSQFFILLEDHPELPKNYTVFGRVISGIEVIDKIQKGDVMKQLVIQALQ